MGIHMLTELPRNTNYLKITPFKYLFHLCVRKTARPSSSLLLNKSFISSVRCKCGSRELCNIPECGDGMRLQVVSPATGVPGFCCDTVQCVNGEYY